MNNIVIEAGGRILADGSEPASRGCTIARVSEGVYRLTLERSLDKLEGSVLVTKIGGDAERRFSADTFVSIGAGAVQDHSFTFIVVRWARGNQ